MKTETNRKVWERITINVTPQEAELLKSAAKKERRSMSSYAAQVLIGYAEHAARAEAAAAHKNVTATKLL